MKKEKKTLEAKRLDLDACKARLRKLSEYANMKDVRYIYNKNSIYFLIIFLKIKKRNYKYHK